MAITAANLTASFDNTDAQSYNTASVSPGANKLILVTVGIRNYSAVNLGTLSLSGNGLTWVEVATTTYSSVASGQSRISIFRSMGASPSAGAITVTVSGSGNASCQWSVDEFDGVDTSGTNGSGAIVQSAVNQSDNCTSGLTVTLAALGDAANNAVYAGFGTDDAQNLTEGSGYTELAAAVGEDALETQYKVPGTTTPNATNFASFGDGGGVAVEIKAAAAGGGGVALAATTSILSTAVGALIISAALLGSAAATSSASNANLGLNSALSGGVAGSLSVTDGSANVGYALNGTASGISSATGTLSVTTPGSTDLAGSAAILSTASGSLSVSYAIRGSGDGVSTSSADLGVTRGLQGSSSGTSTSTGSMLILGRTLEGSAGAASTATGALRASYALAGSANAISTSTGDLSGGTAVQPIFLSATLNVPKTYVKTESPTPKPLCLITYRFPA